MSARRKSRAFVFPETSRKEIVSRGVCFFIFLMLQSFHPPRKEVICMTNRPSEKGQGLVEYALILVLVAIVVIAVLMFLGPIVANVFSTLNNSLSSF